MSKGSFALFLLVIALLSALFAVPVRAAEGRYQRSIESYTMPDVTLVDQNGDKVRFKEIIESDKPVIVDFIYGTCTTICPVLSAGFVNLQRKLGADSQKVHLISVTIDPENDTPAVMKKYLKGFRSQPGWDFLTGSRKDIDRVMNAFNSYFRNKMDHKPITFIRTPSDGKWIKIYGLIGSKDFYNECLKAGII
jgi:protein SCO1/2